MNERLIENCDFDEDELASFRWESDRFNMPQAPGMSPNQPSLSDINQSESSSEDDMDYVPDGTRRTFQLFWCNGQDDNSDFPKPDNYGVRRRPTATPVRNRLLERDLFEQWEDKAEVQYAPKRPPPLLDFAFVFTSFMAALVFAYYSAV